MTNVVISPVWGERSTASDTWGPDWTVIRDGLSPHDRSRGYLAARAMTETSADRFLWLDADTEMSEEQAHRLLDVAREHDADMMTAVYCCRHEAERGRLALNINPLGVSQLVLGPDGAVVPISACGFGAVVTHRRLFEGPYAPEVTYCGVDGREVSGRAWFLPLVRGREHLGEDRSFCVRQREARKVVKFYADTRILVGHAGHTVESVMNGAQQ